jgi:hypothetical protein
MNTSIACHTKNELENDHNILDVTTPALENLVTSYGNAESLLETEEQILNDMTLNESCTTVESVTDVCLQDEEICKDSVYRRPRKMCSLSPDIGNSPACPLRVHGDRSPRSRQFGDQDHGSSHVYKESELTFRRRQKSAEGSYEGINDAEHVMSYWAKYLPVEDEEDMDEWNCSYDLDAPVRKISHESHRFTDKGMTFHKEGIYDQRSDLNTFQSNGRNTFQHGVHAEVWSPGVNTLDIRGKLIYQNEVCAAAGGHGTSMLDVRGKLIPQHEVYTAAGGQGTSLLGVRGKQTPQHELCTAEVGKSTLEVKRNQAFGFRSIPQSIHSEFLENDQSGDQRTPAKSSVDSFDSDRITKRLREDCSGIDTSHHQSERKSTNQCVGLTKSSNQFKEVANSTNQCVELTKSTNQCVGLTKSTNQCIGLSPDLDIVCLSSSPSLYNSPDLKSQRIDSSVSRSFPSESHCDEINVSACQTVPRGVNSLSDARFSSPSSQRVPETQTDIPADSVIPISCKEKFNPPEINPASSPNILIGTKVCRSTLKICMKLLCIVFYFLLL